MRSDNAGDARKDGRPGVRKLSSGDEKGYGLQMVQQVREVYEDAEMEKKKKREEKGEMRRGERSRRDGEAAGMMGMGENNPDLPPFLIALHPAGRAE